MKTILILDDEEVLRDVFTAFFEDRMWQPIQASSAEEALEMLKKEAPAAVLVDIRLPGMGGDEFIRTALKLKLETAFIICTGSPDYFLPPDLIEIPNVSERLFIKPIMQLEDLEKEVLRVVQRVEKPESENE